MIMMEKKIKYALMTTLVLSMILALAAILTSGARVLADDEDAAAAAEEVTETTDETTDIDAVKAVASAALIGAASVAGAIGIALVVVKSVGAIARQPEASGKVQTVMMLGLVFVETVVIYALVTAILIIFVL